MTLKFLLNTIVSIELFYALFIKKNLWNNILNINTDILKIYENILRCG
jgi:hypothetical protein